MQRLLQARSLPTQEKSLKVTTHQTKNGLTKFGVWLYSKMVIDTAHALMMLPSEFGLSQRENN